MHDLPAHLDQDFTFKNGIIAFVSRVLYFLLIPDKPSNVVQEIGNPFQYGIHVLK